jgi:hypothetical protein
MTGRVDQLDVQFWSDEEMAQIAETGFRLLNTQDPASALTTRLVGESFSSPHLMQDFCLQLVKHNGVRQASDQPQKLEAPDWESFFRDRSQSASKTAFDMLARGPRQRTDRNTRQLKGGAETDIYGVVLAAIAKTGPLTQLTYEDLRAAIRDVLAEEPPQRHEVTRILEKMTEIAKERIEGEPVVDYDSDLGTLFIADPFFAFYLRWGAPQDWQPSAATQ